MGTRYLTIFPQIDAPQGAISTIASFSSVIHCPVIGCAAMAGALAAAKIERATALLTARFVICF